MSGDTGGEGEILRRLPDNVPISPGVHIDEAHDVASTQARGGEVVLRARETVEDVQGIRVADGDHADPGARAG